MWRWTGSIRPQPRLLCGWHLPLASSRTRSPSRLMEWAMAQRQAEAPGIVVLPESARVPRHIAAAGLPSGAGDRRQPESRGANLHVGAARHQGGPAAGGC